MFNMLDNDTLSQLKQLKQEIEDSREYAEGVVKGTNRKFGFVLLTDGREVFIDPDEMQKVFPDDKVRILITTEADKKNPGSSKTSGKIEALLEAPLKTFCGRYIVKGQGHFVEPDLPKLSRWIFIPPASRNKARAGDYIRCAISRHPYPGGKPQAKVLEVIGDDKVAGIEADYIASKFQLEGAWPRQWQQQLLSPDLTTRNDLSDLPFITIDAASTQDMDDALFAETTESGWKLSIAIADPSALIDPASELESLIAARGGSCYLPGRVIPMLPESLANDRCSLVPDQQRPALVCELFIDQDGHIADYNMQEALVCSQAKLSYQDVALYLEKAPDSAPPATCQQHQLLLDTLSDVSKALKSHRQQHHLVIDGRPDYRLVLNEQRKLERIDLQKSNSAHELVTECMIAANRCAADMLDEQGLFVSHRGFRNERMPDVKKLAEEQLAISDVDFSTLEGYIQLIKSIDDSNLEFPLRSVLSRLLQRGELAVTPQPHQGMGLPRYTTFTSPLRKYSDFLVHRMLKAKLNGAATVTVSEQQLQSLQHAQGTIRQASYQLEQWLKCQYMLPLVNQTFAGHVSQINSNGFTVRLDEHHIEGFVETRLLKEKYSFDPMRLRLKSKTLTIELDQAIEVSVQEVDIKLRNIKYTLPAAAKENG